MISNAVKITNKGQVTIPKKVRNIIGTDIINFEVINGKVVINAIKSASGSLQKYSKNFGSFDQVRKIAWEQNADDWKK